MTPELYFVELSVADWPASVAWYRDVLGLEVLVEVAADRFALLGAGSGRVALKAGRPEPGSVVLTFRIGDLDAELTRLSSGGVILESAAKTSAEGYRRAVLRDPDGYHICLFEWIGDGAAGARP